MIISPIRSISMTSSTLRFAGPNGASWRAFWTSSRIESEPQSIITVKMLMSTSTAPMPATALASVTWRGRRAVSVMCPIPSRDSGHQAHGSAPALPRSGRLRSDPKRVGLRVAIDDHRVAVAYIAGQQGTSQLITDRTLYEPSQRSSAVDRVVAGQCQPLLGGVAHLERDPPGRESLRQRADLQVDDPGQVL